MAFRLVGLESGSAVLTLEPMGRVSEAGESLVEADGQLAMSNLVSLVESLDSGVELDVDVVAALGSARRSLGDGGTIEIEAPAARGYARVSVDEALLQSFEPKTGGFGEAVRQVSGRLHLIDVEPDRVGIRAPNGVEWSCHYPEELEERIKQLIDRAVVVTGRGRKFSALRGTMTIADSGPRSSTDKARCSPPSRFP